MRYKAVDSVVVGVAMLAVLLSSGAVFADSPSELLEKAIYTEESVGDLNAAVKLYEKVVAEGNKVEAVAAKAQYRLGLCLLKQGKKEQGIAALEEVVKRFPEQKEIVAAARKHLPVKSGLKLLPPCWSDGEALHYRIQLGGGLELGTAIYSAESAQLDGKKIWRFRSRVFAATTQTASRVDADFDTLQPINSTWNISRAGKAVCQYESGKVVLKSALTGKATPQTITFGKVVYDNEEGTFVFRSLPIAEKFVTTVPIFTSIGAGQIDVGFQVQGKETVEVPAGKFACFKVLLPAPINQVFWFSTDEHRYITKIEANGVLMPLAKVETFKPGEPKKYEDSDLGLSLTLPPDWYAYRIKDANQKPSESVSLLEPNADFNVAVTTAKLESLSADEKKGPRAWADKLLPEAAKREKDFQARADAWQTITISGRSAVSFVADYTATDNRKMAKFGVCIFGKTHAARLAADGPRDELERMKKTVLPVVESLEVK